jgi:hypothetical protein
MKKNDQAFPVGYNGHEGMTLRDYFASAAMQGILAGSGEDDGFVRYDAEALAEQVYVMADAMLKARTP